MFTFYFDIPHHRQLLSASASVSSCVHLPAQRDTLTCSPGAEEYASRKVRVHTAQPPSSLNMATFMCRVQYLDDTDPFASTNFPEPTRPPQFLFHVNVPLINQVGGVQKLLGAPHKVSFYCKHTVTSTVLAKQPKWICKQTQLDYRYVINMAG